MKTLTNLTGDELKKYEQIQAMELEIQQLIKEYWDKANEFERKTGIQIPIMLKGR